jgi:cytoskeleton protein RodZ
MSSTPFGEHLRREREMRGVSLDEISAATRISTRFLEAIEKDQWDQLPGGVFNRGFIRSIARFLGLDEDSLVAEYALGNSNGAHAHSVAMASRHMPRNYRSAIATVVVLALVTSGTIFGWHRYGTQISASVHARYFAARAGSRVDAASAPAPAAAAGPTAVLLTLKLQASKPANVKVSADGKIIFDGAVQPGDSRQFDAQDRLEITASESSALSLELNGQALPPIGMPGRPGSVTLTRNDVRPAVGGSH